MRPILQLPLPSNKSYDRSSTSDNSNQVTEPSFFSLFKRGKYVHAVESPARHADAEEVGRSMQEWERFTVAAIAFAWKHDDGFRKHFFDRICRAPGDPDLSPAARILIEPHAWSDLMIENPVQAQSYTYVIECKIDAGLAEIQDPTSDAFSRGTGYGRALVEHFRGRGSSLHYILLRPDATDMSVCPWHDKLPQPIIQQRTWRDLASNLPSNRMCSDLKFSLGKLHIGAFPAADTMNTKVKDSSELSNAIKVLEEVARRLGWSRGAQSLRNDAYCDDDGTCFFGLDLRKINKPVCDAIREVTRPPEKYVSWAGYRMKKEGAVELVVWFYCGSRKLQEVVQIKLKPALPGATLTKEDEGDYFNVVVSQSGHAEKNDSDWFCKVFRALGVKI